ncbi:MAG: WD40 repeat domain-containing protein, partial [Planctomycetaceae bacterium]
RLEIWSAEGAPVADVDALVARVKCLAVHPSGKVLAVGGSDGVVRVWKLGAGLTDPLAEPAHRNTLYGVAFSPDGNWLAVASFDRSISVWRCELSTT